jgi:hypothetical protein
MVRRRPGVSPAGSFVFSYRQRSDDDDDDCTRRQQRRKDYPRGVMTPPLSKCIDDTSMDFVTAISFRPI